ncbi:hypothetical protein FEI17_26290 [Kosakonia radicincitans]|uniref:putative T6SS immunity periplasmic lipoprotein n=1 Tax=Kosakonia radicincitans TaxID=283686 RepID=UPI0011EF7129|nr:putative T6SS immunity periplasmic lipoprotein [Kosakonia radicincitans]QEM93895.1 hypothetical protein FEI17_26290 [Kosakonia radicincitans]
MKKIILIVVSVVLGGCALHNSPYRAADISLTQNGQPCFAVPNDSLTKGGKSKLLVIRVAERFPDNYMHPVWERDYKSEPTFSVQPGTCLPVDYHFEKGKEYTIDAITAFSVSEVETKRIWLASFTLEKLAERK